MNYDEIEAEVKAIMSKFPTLSLDQAIKVLELKLLWEIRSRI